MALVPESDRHPQVNRSSSIYPDASTTDLSFRHDFDFGFDTDVERGSTGTSRDSQDVLSQGSETGLKTTGQSHGGILEKSLGERYIVSWDGPYDAANPQNWPSWRKWTAILIVSAISFVTPLASSMIAPAIPQVSAEFHNTSEALSSFAVTVYILGFGIGPLILAPSSELWGRNIVFNVTNVLFVIFNVACALSDSLSLLTGFRFLAGCAGSAALTIGGGTIADVISPEKRGRAVAVFVVGPVLGPSLGPVAGGFLAEAAGWRWVFWLLAIVSGLMTILTILFLRETYAPKLLRDKVKRLQKDTGQSHYKSELEQDLPAAKVYLRAIIRPLKMLLFSPIILGLSLFMALVYSYIYLLFTTFPLVFEAQYKFSTGMVGLTYLGMGIGMATAAVVVGYTTDRQVAKMAMKSGERKAEYRLPTPLSTYLIDAFTNYAASALAAATVLRSVLGAVLPLAGPKMYESLGLGWGNSLLAFIALAFGVMPWAFYRYGERLRTRFLPRL
ncbi:MAG: hypothetical protein Q9212_004751 [Teloschistes hypoglaucus]